MQHSESPISEMIESPCLSHFKIYSFLSLRFFYNVTLVTLVTRQLFWSVSPMGNLFLHPLPHWHQTGFYLCGLTVSTLFIIPVQLVVICLHKPLHAQSPSVVSCRLSRPASEVTRAYTHPRPPILPGSLIYQSITNWSQRASTTHKVREAVTDERCKVLKSSRAAEEGCWNCTAIVKVVSPPEGRDFHHEPIRARFIRAVLFLLCPPQSPFPRCLPLRRVAIATGSDSVLGSTCACMCSVA